jgi:hypothetical protein
MPDSQAPPPWGPAYDERDLDALLSGQTGSAPPALQPVAGTLAALRAAATRRELSDEARARAAFRALAPASPAPPPLSWATGAEHAAVTSHTLVLPPAEDRPPRAARHRHRRPRPAAGGARRPGIAVATAAAAALIVVAAVVTGALTGSIGDLTSFGRQPASATASARATGRSPDSQGLLATSAARDRPPAPTATASAPAPTPRPTSGPGALCREYAGYFGRPLTKSQQKASMVLYGQLSKLAGSPDPAKVYEYCLRFLDNPLDGRSPWGPDGAPGAGGPAAGAAGGDAGTGGGATAGAGIGGASGAGSQGNQPGGTNDQDQNADPAVGAGRP